nr:olfactory receptor-like protein COR2 [Anser cygnoides]
MAGSNCTRVTAFSLTGLADDPGAQTALFLLFLLIYIVTILANLGMLVLIMASPRLHIPMYYFLGNLAFVDLCSSTAIAPKMLADFLSEKKCITYAGSSIVEHFFCDISPLISLSTSDTTLNQIILRILASLFGVSSGLVVLLSYIAIISTILSIRSAEGKCKAFSTCASHLTVVSIFYGTSIFMYLKASSRDDKHAAVLYTVVTPMLNPLTYSLRNQEVKEALRRLTKMKRYCMLYMYG